MANARMLDGRRSTVQLLILVHSRVPSEPIIQNGEFTAFLSGGRALGIAPMTTDD